MKRKISCEVIQDLLPLYVDQLTQNETDQFIEEHLGECEECNNRYQNMTNKIEASPTQEDQALIEIDYLKKIRKSGNKKIVLSALTMVLIFIILVAVKLFVIGAPVSAYAIDITIENKNAEIEGAFYDSIHVYSGYKIKEGKIIVYGCLPSFWNKNGEFKISYNLNQGDVSLEGYTIKADGQIITAKAEALFNARNPYIGDMVANNGVSNILDISGNLGNYLNSLQTSKEPYGWTLEFQEEVLAGNQAKFDATMEAYACVLLAMVDNCGEVSWAYTCEGKINFKSFTLQDAKEKVGKDIKSYASQPETVQELLDTLSIK